MNTKFKNLPSVSQVLSLIPKNLNIHEKFLTVLIREEIEKCRNFLLNDHEKISREKILKN